MEAIELGAVQEQFADLIWTHEPIESGALVKLCAQQWGWKKSTTYTVLKKLCVKGLFTNDGGTVRACMARETFYARRSQQIVSTSFHGSLPAFFAAFLQGRSLSAQEAAQIQAMIEQYREEK